MLGSRRWLYPVFVWAMLLALIFAIEYTVMLVLPMLLPRDTSRLLEAAVDSVALTIVLAPFLWWTLVRPLREVIRLRTQFLSDLFTQMEMDRRQTATELHDGVGQALTLLISGLRSAKACRVNLECAGRVDNFQGLAENALIEVRRLALGLRPSLLDDLGLAPALERLVEDIRSHQEIKIALDVSDMIGKAPADPVATAVFRIVQEALANVIKHSRAKQASVAVRWAQENVILEISDDGCGIEPACIANPPAGHLGLRGMQERAALLGGKCSIESTPGKETRISITIPGGGVKRG